ncbi:MAG: GNAT family N-acetyltransferase, partial [Deltaproteobacteria bacterium]
MNHSHSVSSSPRSALPSPVSPAQHSPGRLFQGLLLALACLGACKQTEKPETTATAALTLLLAKASEAGVEEVLAEVVPGNHASVRVVEKLGFTQAGARVNASDEHVI